MGKQRKKGQPTAKSLESGTAATTVPWVDDKDRGPYPCSCVLVFECYGEPTIGCIHVYDTRTRVLSRHLQELHSALGKHISPP